jgi:uncharacterized membrane protein
MAWQFYVGLGMMASAALFMGLLGYRAAEAVGTRLAGHRERFVTRHGAGAGLAAAAERFARGEIDEAQYREIKRVLES